MKAAACTAVAGTNIALVKYWGKRGGPLNLPAAGSLSLTLRELEVSCPEIEHMVKLAEDAGALGAKLTGGGGGGCVIAVAPGREAAVQAAWGRAGFKTFTTTVGGAS